MSHVAPCGHPGEPIIGTFVRCTRGCDEVKKPAPVAAKSTVFVDLRTDDDKRIFAALTYASHALRAHMRTYPGESLASCEAVARDAYLRANGLAKEASALRLLSGPTNYQLRITLDSRFWASLFGGPR